MPAWHQSFCCTWAEWQVQRKLCLVGTARRCKRVLRYPLDQAGVISQASGEHASLFSLFMEDLFRASTKGRKAIAKSMISPDIYISKEDWAVNCRRPAFPISCILVPRLIAGQVPGQSFCITCLLYIYMYMYMSYRTKRCMYCPFHP